MAPPPRIRALTREAIPGAPGWIDPLLQMLSENMGQASAAISRRLTFSENFDAELRDVSFTAPYPVWITPTFSGAWAQYADATYEAVRYRIDDRARVYIEGLAAGGAVAGEVFALPVGYRPARNAIIPTVSSSGAYSELRVTSGGSVYAQAGGAVYFGVRCSFEATAPALPTVTEVVSVSHGLGRVGGVLPVYCRAAGASAIRSSGCPAIDWEAASSGRVRIKSVAGIVPGLKYDMRLLLFTR